MKTQQNSAESRIQCKKLSSSSYLRKAHPPLMLGVAIACLTSVVGYRYYDQPQLAVGTIAPSTIKAPKSGSFEDQKTTEIERKKARTGIIPILKRNPQLTEELNLRLTQVIQEIEQMRNLAKPFPFANQAILSSPVQEYLRSSTETDWNRIFKELRTNHSEQSSNPITKKAIAELKNYQKKATPAEFETLVQTISRAREQYTKFQEKLQERQTSELNRADITPFLLLNQTTWQITKQGMEQSLKRILRQGIPPGFPPDLLAESIEVQLSNAIPPTTQKSATELLNGILHEKYNLEVDKEATKHRAEEVAKAVEPVIVQIKQGDIIVKKGEVITQEDFVLLDRFNLSRRAINWDGLVVSGVLVTGAVTIFSLMGRKVHRPLRRRDHLLLCLLSISSPLLAVLNIPFTYIPAIGLLVSSFYGPTLAVTQVVLLTGLTSFAGESLNLDYLIAGTAGGILAALVAGRLRSRDELALLGGGVGIVQGSIYFIIHLIASATAGTIWYAVLPDALVYGLTGVVWCAMALGTSPYLERIFDLVTPIRLVELSHPNCPLLKRLATEAPGTFQHTLFVACLAESAARALHCNVELVRAGTLYHDIGKMHDPKGFIENQMGEPNKHDLIDDPWLSAKIIKKHVTEGLIMARKYGLPRLVQDFIPEHQGTLLISYFYFQAKQRAEQEGGMPFCEDDFRYDGPIPQSRETGIVMLADGSEAALRSLRDATPDIALSTLKKIFKARWQEGQLKDSGLSYEELPIIADIFVQVWQQFHHQRIVYPKAALEPNIK